ncbi:MerR family transcriptional regulator [Nonomuraea salmonea]|uniref:MerR family transcriptional regulator n=1 Tax=Nonomuraea salmonea TaxID=46181 RepID=UPI0031ECB523
MDELYSIGDAARRTGLSVSAIRFYADAGIVAPHPPGRVRHPPVRPARHRPPRPRPHPA